MFKAEFLYSDCPDASHAHCACVVPGPGETTIAAWYAYAEEETKEADLVLARKEGRDSAWTYGMPIELGLASSLANPVLFFDPSGVLWLHFVSLKGGYWDKANWYAACSDDLGRTFTAVSPISQEEGLMLRHGPTFLPSGRALLPIYSDRTRRSFLFESAPPYKTWKRLYDFGDEPIIQPSLVAMRDKLAIFFRPADGPRYTWRSVSTNEGKSWGAPVRLPLPNPLSGISAFALGDEVGLVFNNSTEHKRFPLSISWSDPSLHAWSTPIDLDDPGFEVSYPWFVVDGNSVVHGVYTYNRKFIKYVCFDNGWVKDHDAQD